MIRREFLKKAVIAALAVATGTIAVPKVAGAQIAYKADVLWVVDRMVYFHKQGELDDITRVKNSRFNNATRNEFLVSEYFSPLGFNLNCLDYQDIVNLLFEQTGVTYGIYVEVPYSDYKSYQNIIYNYKNIPKPTDKDYTIHLVFRHGKKEEMVMFTGPIHIFPSY